MQGGNALGVLLKKFDQNFNMLNLLDVKYNSINEQI